MPREPLFPLLCGSRGGRLRLFGCGIGLLLILACCVALLFFVFVLRRFIAHGRSVCSLSQQVHLGVAVGEERSKSHAFGSIRFIKLKECKLLFCGAERPAVVRRDLFDRIRVPVEWAYVAQLHRLLSYVVDPSQREPLSSANVRALLVDSACTRFIQKRARTYRVGTSLCKQRVMMLSNFLSLYVEHFKIVHAARRATSLAVKAIGMNHVKPPCILVNRKLQRFHVCLNSMGMSYSLPRV